MPEQTFAINNQQYLVISGSKFIELNPAQNVDPSLLHDASQNVRVNLITLNHYSGHEYEFKLDVQGGELSMDVESNGQINFNLSTGESFRILTNLEYTTPPYHFSVSDETAFDAIWAAMPGALNTTGTISGSLQIYDYVPGLRIENFNVVAHQGSFILSANVGDTVDKWQYRVASTSAGLSSASWTDIPNSTSASLNFTTPAYGYGQTRYFQVRTQVEGTSSDASSVMFGSTSLPVDSFSVTANGQRFTLTASTSTTPTKWQYRIAGTSTAILAAQWANVPNSANQNLNYEIPTDYGGSATRYFQVRPAVGTANGEISQILSATTPPAVTDFIVTAVEQAFRLTAFAGWAVTKWQYKVSTTEAGLSSADWIDIADSDSSNLIFLTANIGYSSTRYFLVRSFSGSISTSSSSVVSASTGAQPTAPTKPTSFTATADSLRVRLQASTTDGGLDVTKWQYKVATTSGGLSSADWIDIADTASNNLDFTTEVIGQNSTRHFRVRAVNAIGNGTQSDVRSATTTNGDVPSISDFQVMVEGRRLRLKANSEENDLHIVKWQYKEGSSGNLNSVSWIDVVGNIAGNNLNWPTGEYDWNTTRHFQVRAVNNAGNSNASSVVSATTLATPPAIGLIEVKADDGTDTSLFYVPYTTASGEFPDIPFWTSGTGTVADPRVYDHRVLREFLEINPSFRSSSFTFNSDTCWTSLRTSFSSAGKWYIDLAGDGVSAKVYQGNTLQGSINNTDKASFTVTADTDYDIVIISATEPDDSVTMLQSFVADIAVSTDTGIITEKPQGLRIDITGLSADSTPLIYYMTVEHDTDGNFTNPTRIFDIHLDQYHFVTYSQPSNTTFYRARFTRSPHDGGQKGPWSDVLEVGPEDISEIGDTACGDRPDISVCNPVWLGYPSCDYEEGERPVMPTDLCNPTWQGFPTCAWVAADRPAQPTNMCAPVWQGVPVCSWVDLVQVDRPTCPDDTTNDSVWTGYPTCAWTRICTSSDPCYPREENPGNICNAYYDVSTCQWREGDRPVAPSALCNPVWSGYPNCQWVNGPVLGTVTFCNPVCVNGTWVEGDRPSPPECGECESATWRPYPTCSWECVRAVNIDCWGHQVR